MTATTGSDRGLQLGGGCGRRSTTHRGAKGLPRGAFGLAGWLCSGVEEACREDGRGAATERASSWGAGRPPPGQGASPSGGVVAPTAWAERREHAKARPAAAACQAARRLVAAAVHVVASQVVVRVKHARHLGKLLPLRLGLPRCKDGTGGGSDGRAGGWVGGGTGCLQKQWRVYLCGVVVVVVVGGWVDTVRAGMHRSPEVAPPTRAAAALPEEAPRHLAPTCCATSSENRSALFWSANWLDCTRKSRTCCLKVGNSRSSIMPNTVACGGGVGWGMRSTAVWRRDGAKRQRGQRIGVPNEGVALPGSAQRLAAW